MEFKWKFLMLYCLFFGNGAEKKHHFTLMKSSFSYFLLKSFSSKKYFPVICSCDFIIIYNIKRYTKLLNLVKKNYRIRQKALDYVDKDSLPGKIFDNLRLRSIKNAFGKLE